MSQRERFTLRDGETLPHTELLKLFGFKNVRNFKDFVSGFNIPYTPIGYVWWIAAEDIRKALRHQAFSNAEHKERKKAAEAIKS